MRKTKIICTIGPSCQNESVLTEMCKAGMNVARLNFSHGTHEEHLKNINLIKTVREKLKLPIAILLDTKGPEYRIKTFKEGEVFLKEGDEFIFTSREVEGDNHIVSVTYKNLASELSAGDVILVNNGLLSFEVVKISGEDIVCEVVIGGKLTNRKSMSFPNKVLKQEYLSEQDKADIAFGVKNGVDFIACSFVSQKSDLVEVQNYLEELGVYDVELIAKIENQSGVDNIEEICEHCTGIMIGRGDMGVEIPFAKLPSIQKGLITKCSLLGKRVITATEMLESMIENPRPTRAEISDVANAVYDGTSAIMLSGETAVGKYPVLTVKTMAKIAETTEKTIEYDKRFYTRNFRIKNTVDAISHSTCNLAIDIDAKYIVACTISGMTARMVSRFRCPVDIIGLTTSEKVWYRLALSWGVTPMIVEQFDNLDVMFYSAKTTVLNAFNLKKGDKLILTGGMVNGQIGNTNTLKVETV